VTSHDNSTYALNAQTGDLIWKYQTVGFLYSSPAIANGVLYVGSYDHKVYAIGSSTSESDTPMNTYYLIAVVIAVIIVVAAVVLVLNKRHK
jgi:outer membrane protein assembly factor BamB